MSYNKNYRKDDGQGGKKGRKRRIDVAQTVWIVVLLGMLYAMIFHGSEIKNLILGQTNYPSDETENTTVTRDKRKNQVKDEVVENAHSNSIESKARDIAEANPATTVTIDDTRGGKSERRVTTENSADRTASAESKPSSAETATYSNHEIERFVGQDNGKYGVQDLTTKKVLIAPIYDNIKDVRQGLKNPYIIVCKDNLWGVVRINNEVVVPIENSHINEYVYKRDEIYLELTKKDAAGNSLESYVRMPEGKIVVPFKYDFVVRLTNDYKYFKVKENTNDRNSGVVDQNGKLILPIEYAGIETTYKAEGYAIVSKFIENPSDGNHFICGIARLSDGKIIVPIEYQTLEIIGPSSFILAKKNGLYGCINDKNEVIVPFQKVTSVGSSTSTLDDSRNKVHFTLPGGDRVAYNAKGQKVPVD